MATAEEGLLQASEVRKIEAVCKEITSLFIEKLPENLYYHTHEFDRDEENKFTHPDIMLEYQGARAIVQVFCLRKFRSFLRSHLRSRSSKTSVTTTFRSANRTSILPYNKSCRKFVGRQRKCAAQ